MEVRLTPEQARVIEEAVADGRCASAEDAVREALAMWEERQRELEFVASLEEAEADFEAGRGTVVTEENLTAFFEELKEEARALRDSRRR